MMAMKEYSRSFFDEYIPRYGTDSVKWDRLKECFGRDDLEAAWLADMDFRTVQEVQEAIITRAEHGIYGYTDNMSSCRSAEIGWLQRRSGLKCREEWMLFSPGIVYSLNTCIRTLTKPGDSVLIQPPVYSRFYSLVENSGRKLITNPLVQGDGGYEMDFTDLQRKLARNVKLMLLCSPHNPVGRVWSQAELEQLLALVNRYGVIIVVDEIHADLILQSDVSHTRMLSLDEAERCVELTSPTKTFNMSGLKYSTMIVRDEKLRGLLRGSMQDAMMTVPDLFSAVAARTAYECGDAWLDAALAYMRENRDFVLDYLRKIPSISAFPQQGTYLMWLDFRGVGLSPQTMAELLIQRAGVALADGRDFGIGGEGFFRLNLATPRKRLLMILDRIRDTLKDVIPESLQMEKRESQSMTSRMLKHVKRYVRRT